MCFSSHNIPDPPPPAQEGKQPSTDALNRKKRQPVVNGGSYLTSSSGVANGALNTGAPTLLGG